MGRLLHCFFFGQAIGHLWCKSALPWFQKVCQELYERLPGSRQALESVEEKLIPRQKDARTINQDRKPIVNELLSKDKCGVISVLTDSTEEFKQSLQNRTDEAVKAMIKDFIEKGRGEPGCSPQRSWPS